MNTVACWHKWRYTVTYIAAVLTLLVGIEIWESVS